MTGDPGSGPNVIAILGTGWMARALGDRLSSASGFRVVFGSRHPDATASSGWSFPGPVCSMEDAVARAGGVVFLAVPSAAHDQVVSDVDFNSKVVVDISNAPELYDNWFTCYHGPSVAEQLQEKLLDKMSTHAAVDAVLDPVEKDSALELQDSALQAQQQAVQLHAKAADAKHGQGKAATAPRVVKALNTCSAYALKDFFSRHHRVQVPLACNDREAAQLVTAVLEAMQLQAIWIGPLCAAREMEQKQFQVFPEWRWPLAVTCIQMTFWVIMDTVWYLVLLYNGPPQNGNAPRFRPNNWPVKVFTKISAHTGMCSLLILFLGGIVASYYQLIRRDAHSPFPAWLRRWLDMRKQLGLVGMFFIAWHVLIELAYISPAYLATIYETLVPGTNVMFNAYGETMIFLGALAFLLLTIMSVCSLPGVSATLSYKEWWLVFSFGGYAVLLLGFTHAMLYSISFYFCAVCSGSITGAWATYPTNHIPGTNTTYYVPSGISFLLFFAMLVLFLKLLLTVPPLSLVLSRIRGGGGAGRPAEVAAKGEAAKPSGCSIQLCL